MEVLQAILTVIIVVIALAVEYQFIKMKEYKQTDSGGNEIVKQMTTPVRIFYLLLVAGVALFLLYIVWYRINL